MTAEPRTVRLSDYRPPDYLVDRVELRFDLGDDHTRVESRLHCRRHPESPEDRPLVLDGENLELTHLALDGEPLGPERYHADDARLTIDRVPERFQLSVTTLLRPQDNTRLEGLYRSGGMFCTQCEAEGFRRITYFPDRPDIMARYTVTITADRDRCPVLLSNGNPVASGERKGNRHWVRWEDPFPKPCYLFALVAGDLHCDEATHRTPSGRDIRLAIYTEHENAGRTAHAMRSLQAAMAWDERTYGLECDLDNYMIVAVGDFNMGAMENKGLNIFNTQYVLAAPDTATDTDYDNIETVIGHEYFHNWTGNRVTLRDWFQLSLKEGLTVFREQQFGADMGAPAVKRIHEVRTLRAAQFPEDAGPMAHPVRPAEYVEINNFYTATVYLKGAEVIRMYHTLLGQSGFRRGLDEYLRRHDGQAVTCDDFLASMAEANGVDLSQFARWYHQAGTPTVTVRDDYDAETRRYRLTLSQRTDPTPGQPEKQPFHIPVVTGLIGADGEPLRVRVKGDSEPRENHCLELREAERTFTFDDVPQRPVPSLLRGFSAPVRIDCDYSDEDLAFLLAHDRDEFNRWEAGQRLASRILLRWTSDGAGKVPESLHRAFEATLTDTDADPALVAEALTLPAESYIAEQMAVIDIDGVHRAREALRAGIAEALGAELERCYERCDPGPEHPGDARARGLRRLRNVALDYLAARPAQAGLDVATGHFDRATDMTDAMAALSQLADFSVAAADERLSAFYEKWRDDPLVVDKWFRVQAASRRADTLERVRRLTRHEAFSLRNPNKVRALIGAFSQANPVRFHDVSGAGYAFLADQIITLNGINPQIAARLASPLTRWRRYDEKRRELMRAELERIFAQPSLSNDVYEVVAKSLESTQ